MGKLKEMMKEAAPVHERKLQARTYPLPDGNVIVEGSLRDERLVGIHHWSGDWADPGVVHHMVVRLLVGDWPLTILDAEADMIDVPRNECPETLDSVKKIIGVPIVSGYSEEIRKRLGGINGCTHMTHLIVVMGPAALHGFWTHAARNPRPIPKSMEEVPGLKYLVNSCKLWAEDGPIMDMIRKSFEDQGKDE